MTKFEAKLYKLMKFIHFFIVSLLILTTFSCKRNPLDVDTSDVKLEIQYINLDSLLFNTSTDKLIDLRQQMGQKIPELFDYQIGYCMRIGKVVDTAFVNSIVQYRQDTMIQKLEKEIAQKFSNLSPQKINLTIAFKRLKAHINTAKIPTSIVFQNSLFTSSAFCTEKEIGIGLERYLGAQSPIIKSLPGEPFYDWIKIGYDVQYLERDAVLSWVLTHIIPETKGNLAELMIYHGKALYLTEACLPESEKNVIIRYSKEDLKWSQENEYSMWKYLVDEKLLFKTDDLIAKNMLQEGPFTSGLPEKGPDRLGQFLGWVIVKNYMENSETTFEELINTPYNEILQSYQPK
jgi:hypothetical protein